MLRFSIGHTERYFIAFGNALHSVWKMCIYSLFLIFTSALRFTLELFKHCTRRAHGKRWNSAWAAFVSQWLLTFHSWGLCVPQRAEIIGDNWQETRETPAKPTAVQANANGAVCGNTPQKAAHATGTSRCDQPSGTTRNYSDTNKLNSSFPPGCQTFITGLNSAPILLCFSPLKEVLL